MRIAMVASEANPFVKTGGLADVIYSLSKELAKENEVIVVLPFYASIKTRSLQRVTSYWVDLSWRRQEAEIYKSKVDGITYYLIANDFYFGRASTYGYDDDNERFAFFTLAARELFHQIGYRPDIIHVHDWQPGMLPVLVKEENQGDPTFADTKFVLTIHNPFFKGMFAPFYLGNYYNLSEELYTSGKVRYEGSVSSLKAAIMYCDKITTVSPSHAKELLTYEGSQGLDGVLKLREEDFSGIVNGIDVDEFNPTQDKVLVKQYCARTLGSGKSANRARLLEVAGMHDSGGPIFGFVSRLTFQKGINLILDVASSVIEQGGMILALGSGEYELEQGLERLRARYPQSVGIYIGYNDIRAHEIYAASDFFLMPSLFEPCGIGQMIAERYGALPIVRLTGGLIDTVVPYDGANSDTANGIAFRDYDAGGLAYGCHVALKLYQNQKEFRKLQNNAMKTDNSWKKSAEAYLKVYKSIKE